MTTTLPSIAQAAFPPSYVEAIAALRACAKNFTPERYTIAAMALAKCWHDDEPAAGAPIEALGTYGKMANDNTLMRLASKVDALHKAWKAVP